MENEKRVIDANALDFDFPVTDYLIEIGIEMVRARVVTAPTVDAVEVVRCKDCKHYANYGRVWDCRKYGGMSLPDDDDFCSYGERREGE